MQPSLGNAVGPLLFVNDIVMVVSNDDPFDQIDADCEKDDIAYWNDEMDDDCEDDNVGRHDDYSEQNMGEDNDILNCNHANSSTKHAITVVLKNVLCNNHTTTVVLEDVEYDDPVYDNLITGDNVLEDVEYDVFMTTSSLVTMGFVRPITMIRKR
ncbi:Uncharacterized protein TCM_036396 [Theobroma cacao]|uniref:Uncharacterized protein n=1 Tax=Theobroma cacao TaxID=3641 RepID=A0A061FKR3_THECC|nr:Uncharacterized protein TCM_036396 [Theobroma cacao]